MDVAAERARKRLGARAESAAAWRLRVTGARVLARQLRVRGGCEVDIVCREGTTLVLVEVKARRSGEPAAAVDASRQRALRRSADVLLAEHRWARDVRIDVVAIRWPMLRRLRGAV